MIQERSRIGAEYVRNFVFGVEDSLVSTVGLVAGIAAAKVESGTILITGIVLIFVEAFSMGVGSFLSETSAEEYEAHLANIWSTIKAGVIMFISYFVAGFIPLFPYALWSLEKAFWFSILLSVIALFALGIFSGRISRRSPLKTAIRMTVLGGMAIALGVIVGTLLKI